MTDLTTTVNGLKLPNPFIIGSGPPGTNANVIGKAFDEGWGAVIAKTISLDASKVVNVAPRYARMRANGSKEVFGWENIELISDRPFETWIEEFSQLKNDYPAPANILIASVMEEYNRDAWIEIIERCQDAGVDAFELNFSCPHGLPERKMGSAMGQDPDILEEVCGWVMSAAKVPVWAKMTPNITHIASAGRAALKAGCDGLSAINTILCVMGVDLKTLRPEPTVEGYTTPGGYSCKAVKPVALRMVMELAQMMKQEFGVTCSPSLSGRGSGGGSSAMLDGDRAQHDHSPTPDVPGTPPSREGEKTLSGIGGIETGEDAAQFILLGAHTVQVCTGVMIHSYKLIHELCDGLRKFMDQHGFNTIDDFRGHSLQFFTTHADLVARQAAARAVRDGMVRRDTEWTGDRFVEQSDKLVAN